jgi:hypothetical protein
MALPALFLMTTIKPISTPRVFESIASHANRLNERAAAVDRYGSSLASAWEEQGSVPDQSTIRRPKRMSCLFGEQSEAFGMCNAGRCLLPSRSRGRSCGPCRIGRTVLEQLVFGDVRYRRYWHLADIPLCTAHVRYWGKADMDSASQNVC